MRNARAEELRRQFGASVDDLLHGNVGRSKVSPRRGTRAATRLRVTVIEQGGEAGGSRDECRPQFWSTLTPVFTPLVLLIYIRAERFSNGKLASKSLEAQNRL